LAWYLKGLPNAHKVKDSIMELTARDAVVAMLTEYVQSVEEMMEQDQPGETESGSMLVH
jgi:tRNA-dihydrouridine synthase B